MERIRPILPQAAGILIFLSLLVLARGPALWFFHRLSPGPLVLLLLIFPAGLWFVRRPWSEAPVQIKPWLKVFFAALAGLFCWVFRMQLLLPPPEGNGDSIFLMEQVPVYTELFGFRATLDEILELYVHSKFYLVVKWAGGSILDSYAILSCAAGALYTGVLLFYLDGKKPAVLAAGLVLLLAAPAVQIFFGYAEHYDTPALLLLSMCVFCLRFLETEREPGLRDFALLGLLSALALLFHLITAAAALALIWFVWHKSKKTFLRNAAAAAVPAAVLLGCVLSYFLFFAEYPVSARHSFAARPPFYPVSEFISVRHFTELFNLLMIGMPALLILAWSGLPRFQTLRENPAFVFLFLMFAGFFSTSILINPLLGYPADWDLLTLFSIPGNLCLLQIWQTNRPRRMEAVLPGVAALCITITALWVARNHEASPASIENLRTAEQNSSTFLTLIEGDRVYQALPRDRRKAAVEVKLFFVGAESKVMARRDMGLMFELADAKKEYDLFLQLDNAEYSRQLPVVLAKLTDLNKRISALP